MDFNGKYADTNVPVRELMYETWSQLHGSQLHTWDKSYYFPVAEEAKKLLRLVDNGTLRWLEEVQDCDNLAIDVSAQINRVVVREGLRGAQLAFGRIAGRFKYAGKHMANIMILDTGEIWLPEPQNGVIYSPDDVEEVWWISIP